MARKKAGVAFLREQREYHENDFCFSLVERFFSSSSQVLEDQHNIHFCVPQYPVDTLAPATLPANCLHGVKLRLVAKRQIWR